MAIAPVVAACEHFRVPKPPRGKISRAGFVTLPGPRGGSSRALGVLTYCDTFLRLLRRHTDIKLSRRDHAFVLLHGWSRPVFYHVSCARALLFDLRRPSAHAVFCSRAFARRSCKWWRPLRILGSHGPLEAPAPLHLCPRLCVRIWSSRHRRKESWTK